MPFTFRPRAALTTIAALVVLPLSLVACGGGSDSGSATAASTSASDRDAARVRLAQCLREHGLDIPDDPGQSGGRPRNFSLRLGDRSKVDKAMQACRKYRDQAFGQITEAQREEFRDAFTKFSACMRRNGVDLPDPPAGGPGGGGVQRRSVRPPGGRRQFQNDPDFQKAMEACRKELPQGGRGGGPGGGPGIFIGPGPRGQ